MQAAAVEAHRPAVEYDDMARPLEVGGVGSGTQKTLQFGMHSIVLSSGNEAAYESPALPNLGTPTLLGQKA